MANLGITDAQVQADDDAKVINGRFGVAVTPGDTVFYEEESQSWQLASATGTLAQARTQGVALITSSIGGRGGIQTDGRLILGAGAAPAKGTVYIQGAVLGSIAPDADAIAGWKKTVIGVGDGAGGIYLMLNASGQIVP